MSDLIPEAAVEVAARRLYLDSPLGRRTCEAWEYIGEATQADYRVDALRILEAAAPHMLKQAWNEGHGAGQIDPYCLEGNPYDPQDRPTP